MTGFEIGILIILAIIALTILAAVIGNNFFKPEYTKLVAGVAPVADPLLQKIHDVVTRTPPPVAPVPISVQHSVTVNNAPPTGVTAGPVAVVQPESYNDVPVPTGMSLATFYQLVAALLGVRVMLGNTDLHTALLASSDAWWADGVGPYYREQLLAQSTGDVLAAFTVLAKNGPALIPITPEQQAAAVLAAKV